MRRAGELTRASRSRSAKLFTCSIYGDINKCAYLLRHQVNSSPLCFDASLFCGSHAKAHSQTLPVSHHFINKIHYNEAYSISLLRRRQVVSYFSYSSRYPSFHQTTNTRARSTNFTYIRLYNIYYILQILYILSSTYLFSRYLSIHGCVLVQCVRSLLFICRFARRNPSLCHRYTRSAR
jgi:hypothetical protein